MRFAALCLIIMYSCVVAGCGAGASSIAPVSGSIRVNGQPLKLGRICFYPEKGRPAIGEIGADGTYRLTTVQTGDGATMGKHRVTIEAVEVIGAPKTMAEESAQAGKTAPPATVKWFAAERFSRVQSTDLEAEVKPGDNQINFNLPER
jgi:hypothetical protein